LEQETGVLEHVLIRGIFGVALARPEGPEGKLTVEGVPID